MSTWQLGVKHSITKRCTRGPCREVRLVAVANPRRVCAPSVPLSVQVERGLGGRSSKGCATSRSWLKRSASVRANRSVDRLVPRTVPAATVNSRAARAAWIGPRPCSRSTPAPGVPRAGPPVPSALLRCPLPHARAGRAPPLLGQERRAPLGPAQQDQTGPGHGRETEGRSGRAGERGAVPEEDHRDQDTAEGRPADHLAHRVRRRRRRGARSGARSGRGRRGGGGRCRGGGGAGGGAGSGHVLLPGTHVLLPGAPVFSMLSMAVAATGSTRVRPAGHCPAGGGSVRKRPARPRTAMGVRPPGEPCANRLYGAATIALRAPSHACSLERRTRRAGSGQRRSAAVPLGVWGWEDVSQTQLCRSLSSPPRGSKRRDTHGRSRILR